jgi:hypothetical protein
MAEKVLSCSRRTVLHGVGWLFGKSVTSIASQSSDRSCVSRIKAHYSPSLVYSKAPQIKWVAVEIEMKKSMGK